MNKMNRITLIDNWCHQPLNLERRSGAMGPGSSTPRFGNGIGGHTMR